MKTVKKMFPLHQKSLAKKTKNGLASQTQLSKIRWRNL